MTKHEAEDYVRRCGETDGPDGDRELLVELFTALYDRGPDSQDWRDDVWSLCCAAVD